MTSKGQMAMAVGAGYMLGRTHKMKLALMLAGYGASRRFPGGSLGVLNEGRKLLADSPEVAKLGATVRKELMNAAKAAAVTAASQRIDSLNTRLQSGEGLLGGAGKEKKSKRARDEEPADNYEDDYEDEESADDEDEGADETGGDDSEQTPRARRRPAPRRRSSAGGGSRPTRSRSRSKDDDEDEDELSRARRTRAKATTDSVPVRRTRK
ncbi:hypothetical protein [Rhodococcus koreensis]|uniref:hypothetical protein n=1 Tax=Rhodococcus koreensis TaxID=99653 RepID=UPI00366B3F16